MSNHDKYNKDLEMTDRSVRQLTIFSPLGFLKSFNLTLKYSKQ